MTYTVQLCNRPCFTGAEECGAGETFSSVRSTVPNEEQRAGYPPMITTLTRAERIRRRPEFLTTQRCGSRTAGRYLTLVGRQNGRAMSRLGVVASRRLGKAVARNRVKRRVRELFRHNKPNDMSLDLVVLPLREFLKTPFASLQDDYYRTLRRQLRSLRSR